MLFVFNSRNMAAQIMTPEHKEKLIINRKVLVKSINDKLIYSGLLQESICTTRELTNIIAERTRQKEVKKLLYILQRKPDEAYKRFIKTLRQTGHEHIANLLEPRDFIISQTSN